MKIQVIKYTSNVKFCEDDNLSEFGILKKSSGEMQVKEISSIKKKLSSELITEIQKRDAGRHDPPSKGFNLERYLKRESLNLECL